MTKDAAKIAADLEIAKASMNADETKYHDGLKDEAAKKSFRALSSVDRATAISKAAELAGRTYP